MFLAKNLAAGISLLLLVSSASAQSHASIDIQRKIDSLETVRRSLLQQIEHIDRRVESLESALKIRQVEQLEAAELVIVTNMEASLRTQPSPGARVLRIIPEKTPLAALDFEGAYWKVRYMGIEGWIMRLFVDEGEEADAFKKSLPSNRLPGEAISQRPSEHARERAGKNFLVTTFGMHPPNNAGGVSLYYAFEHLDSTRTIREVTFSVTPFDANGEIEKGNNSGVSTRRLRRFGPISVQDGERRYEFENVWYNEEIACVRIDRIDITYTDGTRMTRTRDVDETLARTIANDCSVSTAAQVELPEDGH